jgi:hypothetical protein
MAQPLIAFCSSSIESTDRRTWASLISPFHFVKNWSYSKLFIGFLILIWEEMCTFATGY